MDPQEKPTEEEAPTITRTDYTITESGRAVIEEFLQDPDNRAWHDALDTTPETISTQP